MRLAVALLLACAYGSARIPIPVAFEPNQGQASAGADFVVHTAGYTVALSGASARFATRGATVTSRLLGARDAAGSGEMPLPATVSYLRGAESQWIRGLSTFSRVRYPGVYPGIDLLYYVSDGALEYDFLVAPGANPRQITWDFQGARHLSLRPSGDLAIETPSGILLQHRPAVYQTVHGVRRAIPARYVLRGNVGRLQLGRYDRSLPLVIDPALTWAGFTGTASTGTASGTIYDDAQSVAADPSGNIYIAGITFSSLGDDDAFVVKLDPAGALLMRVTIGGEGDDDGYSIAVDSTGAVYVVGDSTSLQWQISTSYAGLGTDAFYAKINSAFSNYVYAGFFGADGGDRAYSCAIDASNNLYFAGVTSSTRLLVTRGAPQTSNGGSLDGFIVKLDPSGSQLFTTYLGGSGDEFLFAITTDSAGNFYTTGQTASTNLPVTSNAPQKSAGGGLDVVVAKYTAAGALAWMTYLGGTADDEANGIAVDAAGATVIAGGTASANFPVANAYQPASAGGARDMFASKLDADGSKLLWSTYLGGSGDDLANALALDNAGNVYIGGSTNSTNFPSAFAWQQTNKGGAEGTVSSLSADGATLVFSSYIGGTATDYVTSVAVNCAAGLVVAGSTQSRDFPGTLSSAPNLNYAAGAAIGFVAKIAAGGSPAAIAEGGIVNTFTGASAPVAPGSLVSIYGAALAGAAGSAGSTPLPTTLNGVTVTVNGATVPLFYVSPTQINFQLPFETGAGTANAIVNSGCGASSPVNFSVASAAPYLLLGSTGDAVVLNQDGTLNSSDNPAPKGSIVVAYLTGIGALDKPITTGAPTPADLFSASLPYKALIGGFDTSVKFLGMTPYYIGLSQANLEIPNLSPGKYPIVITVNGVDSNAASMYVK